MAKTEKWQMEAYAEVAEKFGLRAKQRDRLDVSPGYGPILEAARDGKWRDVADMLIAFGITR
jgi:hypothetical protein